jgi:hypothetical protein
MNITKEQSREAFEAWSRDGHASTFDLGTSKNGRYLNGDIHCAWEGWQAAIRFAQQTQDPWDVSPEVAEAILRARDAHYLGEMSEVYHELYRIADPGFSSFEPWDRLEKIAGDRYAQGHLTTPPRITSTVKDQLP